MSYSSPITITAADIAGANAGQRPDLLAFGLQIYRTSDGQLYRVWRGRLVNDVIPLSEDTTLRVSDDGLVFRCTTAVTITVPELLSPRPSCVIHAPPTGDVSLDPAGAAQLNGAGTTLTRSRANNPAGFVVSAYAESDGYGVSGS